MSGKHVTGLLPTSGSYNLSATSFMIIPEPWEKFYLGVTFRELSIVTYSLHFVLS